MDSQEIKILFNGKQFFSLPFVKGTKTLLRSTIDQFANYDSSKLPYRKDQVHVISFKGGILILAVKEPREKEQRVSFKVTEDLLLVSCSSHQGECYLSYYASVSLDYLLGHKDSANFAQYY
ncbi:hypothetical protein H7F33_05390 [Pedobacter sp. PAMC26386]|nr:hypothetical protein H7F33_05390 [Pedobacter sp. PAMC26386]